MLAAIGLFFLYASISTSPSLKGEQRADAPLAERKAILSANYTSFIGECSAYGGFAIDPGSLLQNPCSGSQAGKPVQVNF